MQCDGGITFRVLHTTYAVMASLQSLAYTRPNASSESCTILMSGHTLDGRNLDQVK